MCKGVQQTAKTIITATIIRVTRFLFSWPLPGLRDSRLGPGPCDNAADPFHNRINMFAYNARMATNGISSDVRITVD